jgi:hypothetical protein
MTGPVTEAEARSALAAYVLFTAEPSDRALTGWTAPEIQAMNLYAETAIPERNRQ